MALLKQKLIAGGLAAATLMGSVGLATEAEAAWRHRGAPLAAGVFGGLALGALAAGAANSYYAPRPYNYAPAYGECHRERQPVYDRFGGFMGYRIVRVCY